MAKPDVKSRNVEREKKYQKEAIEFKIFRGKQQGFIALQCYKQTWPRSVGPDPGRIVNPPIWLQDIREMFEGTTKGRIRKIGSDK